MLNECHLMKKKALIKHLARAGRGSHGPGASAAPAGILISTFSSLSAPRLAGGVRARSLTVARAR